MEIGACGVGRRFISVGLCSDLLACSLLARLKLSWRFAQARSGQGSAGPENCFFAFALPMDLDWANPARMLYGIAVIMMTNLSS